MLPEVNASAARSPLLAWLQLARVTNLPTAWADVLAGYLLLGRPQEPVQWGALFLLMGASTSLYTAGMILNDVADADEDARCRPQRPIPAGCIPLATARAAGWFLLVLGPALAFLAGALQGGLVPGAVALGLAVLVAGYDYGLKRLWLGPLALAACRGLNLLLGASAWPLQLVPPLWVAGALSLYVLGLSWFARHEDRDPAPRAHLVLGWLLVLSGFLLLAFYPPWADSPLAFAPGVLHRWQALLAVLAVVVSWRCARAVWQPNPLHVQVAVGQMLLSIIVFDAAAVMPVAGPRWAMLVLALLVPAVLLRRWSRPT